MLCFQAEGGMLGVSDAEFPGTGAIQKVTGVKLQAGFGGGNGQSATAARVIDHRSAMQAGAGTTVKDEVVVIPAGDLELRIRIADVQTNGHGFAEVQGRAGDRRYLACRDQACRHRRVTVCIDL